MSAATQQQLGAQQSSYRERSTQIDRYQSYSCPNCDQALRVSGVGRHRIYFMRDAKDVETPVVEEACPQCGKAFPGKNSPMSYASHDQDVNELKTIPQNPDAPENYASHDQDVDELDASKDSEGIASFASHDQDVNELDVPQDSGGPPNFATHDEQPTPSHAPEASSSILSARCPNSGGNCLGTDPSSQRERNQTQGES